MKLLDPISSDPEVDRLVRRAVETEDVDEYMEILRQLVEDGSRYPPVMEAAANLLRRRRVKDRRIGAALLGRKMLGEDPPMVPERSELLLKAVARERSPKVLHAIAVSMGHIHVDERCIEHLVAISRHRNEWARIGAGNGLLMYDTPAAIEAKIALTQDVSAEVRDWGTTGLAIIDADSEEIREALFERLTDEDEMVREEAIHGLGRRGDERALVPLIELLGSEAHQPCHICLEAAERLASPMLLPSLERILTQELEEVRNSSEPDTSYVELIENAMASCRH